MNKEDAIAKRDEVLRDGEVWETVEAVTDKNGQVYPVIFHNTIFKEGECCIIRFAAGARGFEIHITPDEDGKLDFGVSCSLDREWFSSKDFNECIGFMKKSFLENKQVSE